MCIGRVLVVLGAGGRGSRIAVLGGSGIAIFSAGWEVNAIAVLLV